MAYISMTLDKEKMRAAAKQLQKSPDVVAELEHDPKEFLARFGVNVDDATSKSITKRLSGVKASGGKPAGIVHIDIPT